MPLSVTFGSKADESPDHHARSRAGMRTFEEALRSLTENNEFQGFDIDVGREIANEFKYMEMLITAALIYWAMRSEEHTSELQSLMRISYAVFCLKKKKKIVTTEQYTKYRCLMIMCDPIYI